MPDACGWRVRLLLPSHYRWQVWTLLCCFTVKVCKESNVNNTDGANRQQSPRFWYSVLTALCSAIQLLHHTAALIYSCCTVQLMYHTVVVPYSCCIVQLLYRKAAILYSCHTLQMLNRPSTVSLKCCTVLLLYLTAAAPYNYCTTTAVPLQQRAVRLTAGLRTKSDKEKIKGTQTVLSTEAKTPCLCNTCSSNTRDTPNMDINTSSGTVAINKD